MSVYILLMHDDEIWQNFSDDDQAKWINEYRRFAKEIDARLVQGDPVNSVGRMLTKLNGEVNVELRDYTGNPDSITGYFIFTAEDWDEAVKIASGCPTIEYGGRIQLRQVGH
jgi:hypothetical protein